MTTATTFTAEITELYQDIQYGAAPAADLASDLALLAAGQETLSQIQSAIEADAYSQDTVDPVVREYQAAFGRVPDQAGVAYWVNMVGANPAALATLSTTFANSAEFAALYGATAATIGGQALVSALYENVLGRQPDAAGLAYWVVQNLTAAQLLQAFAQSVEFINDAAAAITAYQNGEANGAPATTGSLLSLALPAGDTFTLTTGQDAITAPSVPNNIVLATQATLTSGDSINLGATTGNVLSWTDSSDTAGVITAVPPGVTVSGVQTADFDAKTALDVNTRGWAGLDNLNVVSASSGQTTDTITADPTTAVSVIDVLNPAPGGSAAGELTVNGGSSVTIKEYDNVFSASNTIDVEGGPGTTRVSVTQITEIPGVYQGVDITDTAGTSLSAGTITTVALSGLGSNNAEIKGGAVSDLVVSNALATVSLNDGGVLDPASTLNLSLSNADIHLDDEAGNYRDLNVATGVYDPAVGLDGSHLYADFASTVTETIAGQSILIQTADDLSSLQSIVVTGEAGLSEDFLSGDAAKLTAITSSSTGLIDVVLNGSNAEQTTFTGGAGTDIVSINYDPTAAITAGSATNNEIILNNAATSFTAAGAYTEATGFQILGVAEGSSGTFNLLAFKAPISDVDIAQAPQQNANLVFTNAAEVQTLSIDQGLYSGAAASNPIGVELIQSPAAAASQSDVLNLTLGTSPGPLSFGSNGVDTSDLKLGSPVGTLTLTQAELTAAVSASNTSQTGFVAPNTWSETLTVTGVTLTGSPIEVQVGSAAISIVAPDNSTVDTAALIAWTVDSQSAELGVTAFYTPGTSVVTLIANALDTPEPSYTVSTGAGIASTITPITPGSAGTGVTDTLTVLTSPAAASVLAITDSLGDNFGSISVAAGATVQAIAAQIAALLNGQPEFSGAVTASNNTVTATYAYGVDPTLSIQSNKQITTLDLKGVSVSGTQLFTETFTDVFGDTQTVSASAGTISAAVAGLVNAINALSGSTGVAATDGGSSFTLTTTDAEAAKTFTASQVLESNAGVVGSQTIQANGYETVSITSQGIGGAGNGANTTNLVDNAIQALVVTGVQSLDLAISGGQHLSSIDTTGAGGPTAFINLAGAAASEVTTGITATLGNASVLLDGNAGSGSIDQVVGGTGSDTIFGTEGGGSTHVTLGNGADLVDLFTGAANTVSLGNGAGDVVNDASSGVDTITLGNGAGDAVTLNGGGAYIVSLGNGAGDVVTIGALTGSASVTLGNGAGDVVMLGNLPGTATVTLGTGAGDSVTFGTETAVVTFQAHSAADAVSFSTITSGYSPFAAETTTAQTSINTASLDVITGLIAGNQIKLGSAVSQIAIATNLAGVAGHAELAEGTYNASAHSFTASSSGHDSLLTFDTGGGHFDSVVLVGVSVTAHVAGAGDVITLA